MASGGRHRKRLRLRGFWFGQIVLRQVRLPTGWNATQNLDMDF